MQKPGFSLFKKKKPNLRHNSSYRVNSHWVSSSSVEKIIPTIILAVPDCNETIYLHGTVHILEKCLQLDSKNLEHSLWLMKALWRSQWKVRSE
jgi:hypothetical protein